MALSESWSETSGELWQYEYDLKNRLVSVKHGEAGIQSLNLVASYAYDMRDLRVSATRSGETSYYQYDLTGDLIYSEEGEERRVYIQALGETWAEVRSEGTESATYYHHSDHLGTTELITDEDGKIVWSGSYEPFGTLSLSNGSLDFRAKYTGKELDEDTGLYYFNARWYDAELGRFISEDPARDGENWFGYVGNRPLVSTDPSGLETCNPELVEEEYGVPFGYDYYGAKLPTSKISFGEAIEERVSQAGAVGDLLIPGFRWLRKGVAVAENGQWLDAGQYAIAAGAEAGTTVLGGKVIGGLLQKIFPLAHQLSILQENARIGAKAAAAGSEGRIVTVLGSQRDTAKYLGKPGYNVLKVPDSEWSAKLNIKWLDGAIRRGDEIRFVTDPVKFEKLMIDLGKKSQFIDLEIPYLKWRGVMDTVTKGF